MKSKQNRKLPENVQKSPDIPFWSSQEQILNNPGSSKKYLERSFTLYKGDEGTAFEVQGYKTAGQNRNWGVLAVDLSAFGFWIGMLAGAEKDMEGKFDQTIGRKVTNGSDSNTRQVKISFIQTSKNSKYPFLQLT